jgi:dCMP deaminase
MNKWDDRFMDLARTVGGWSKDRSTKVGCVIIAPDRGIISTGYNGFPRGVDDTIEARHERPAKYKYTEHAERNAIYAAAKRGVTLQGSTMVLPWFPCAHCAMAIVQSGIRELVAIEPNLQDPRWGEDFKVATEILSEGGIAVRFA